MSSLFTDLKHINMKDIKRKLEQLTYEIKLVKSDEPDNMTGVMIRLEELTDLVNKLLIPDVVGQSEQLKAEVFTLANKLAVAGEGDAAVAMHSIHNRL